MFGIGFLELVVIATAILICVGPNGLPEFFNKLASFAAQVTRISNEIRWTITDALQDEKTRSQKPPLQNSDQKPHDSLSQSLEHIDEHTTKD